MSKKYPCPAGREPDCGYPACAHDRQCELADPCSLPDRSELSIRISDALLILDDLEASRTVYGGFAKGMLRRIRTTLKPEAENEGEQP